MSGIAEIDAPSHRSGAVTVAGVRVDSFTEASLVERIMQWVERPGTRVAVGVNAHTCNLARRDPAMRAFLDAHTTYADGQSVVWGARFMGGHLPERLATTDIAEPVLRAAAQRGIPVYFLGAADGVAAAAAERMRARVPGVDIATHHGYLGDGDSARVLEEIAAHGTGILFIGIGEPAQQMWVRDHAVQLPPVVLTCGGLFDWLSGSNKRAPRWMIRAGLEWLWRLCIEPHRLAKRYLVGNPLFIAALIRQRITAGAR